jgi:membrane protein implicated in regulation of membrane protease activity
MEILWWHWVAAGMALMVCEVFIPSFTIFWFGLGGMLTGGLLYLVPDLEFSNQIFTWAVSSAAFTLLWFKVINPRISNKSLSGMALEAIKGQSGLVVVQPLDTKRGRVRFSVPLLGSDEWEFICEEPVKVGDRVTVVDHSGNTLVVKAKN